MAVLSEHTTRIPSNCTFDAAVHNAWINKTIQKHFTDIFRPYRRYTLVMNIATKSRDAGERTEGSKRPSRPLVEGGGGAKVPFLKCKRILFRH